ncbi:hypothetical protein V492_05845, partial [Pseudogymnoascus sp. VKM F-4246]
KKQPNFAPTGLLAAETKTVTTSDGAAVVLKYHEPPEARKPPPRDAWKLFVFKNGDIVDTIDLGTRSCWLIGRDASIADLPAEHPSISKQHAVLQFRFVEKVDEYGDRKGGVKPYLLDLESANGTKLNGGKVEGASLGSVLLELELSVPVGWVGVRLVKEEIMKGRCGVPEYRRRRKKPHAVQSGESERLADTERVAHAATDFSAQPQPSIHPSHRPVLLAGPFRPAIVRFKSQYRYYPLPRDLIPNTDTTLPNNTTLRYHVTPLTRRVEHPEIQITITVSEVDSTGDQQKPFPD